MAVLWVLKPGKSRKHSIHMPPYWISLPRLRDCAPNLAHAPYKMPSCSYTIVTIIFTIITLFHVFFLFSYCTYNAITMHCFPKVAVSDIITFLLFRCIVYFFSASISSLVASIGKVFFCACEQFMFGNWKRLYKRFYFLVFSVYKLLPCVV